MKLDRRVLLLGGAATLLTLPAAAAPLYDDRLLNPCYDPVLPERLANHDIVRDISAIVQRNRAAEAFPTLLHHTEWHPQLLWGSDYPLPGVLPLISVAGFAKRGLLPANEVPVLNEIRRHNPLLFDFVLKRRLAAAPRASRQRCSRRGGCSCVGPLAERSSVERNERPVIR